VCGITNLEDARLACACGADALGFIFYEKSPRYVTPETAGEIMRRLPPFVCKVGVVVNRSLAEVQALARTLPLNLIQLHGDESAEFCHRLGLPFLKVFRVGDGFEPEVLRRYPAAGFLLDTYRPNRYGGTGETFDWRVARAARRFGRIVLSGGLNPNNVAEAVRTAQPYAVDVCSGVEAEPGKKDPEALRAFFRAIKAF